MEKKTLIERIRESLHRDLTRREAVKVAVIGTVAVFAVTGLLRLAVEMAIYGGPVV